jgi:hypothetical protein
MFGLLGAIPVPTGVGAVKVPLQGMLRPANHRPLDLFVRFCYEVSAFATAVPAQIA